jgi:hypothetical protein
MSKAFWTARNPLALATATGLAGPHRVRNTDAAGERAGCGGAHEIPTRQ